MRKSTKLLITAATVGVLGSLAAFGVFASFTATTQNAGNELTAGTVSLSNNSAGQAMFNIANADTGTTWTSCIKVTYTGGLPADVRIYLGGTPGPLAPYLTETLDEGTTTGPDVFPACTTFVKASTLWTGTFAGVQHDYASGWVASPGGVPGAWTTGSSTVYRVTVTLDEGAPTSGQGQSSGNLTAYWEAHNQ